MPMARWPVPATISPRPGWNSVISSAARRAALRPCPSRSAMPSAPAAAFDEIAENTVEQAKGPHPGGVRPFAFAYPGPAYRRQISAHATHGLFVAPIVLQPRDAKAPQAMA